MTYPWWSLLPFVAMLACIALLPIIPKTSHWWEKESSQLFVALLLGVPTTVWMFMKAGTGPLIATGVEYVQFIALLFALFVVSGGIHLAGDIKATPRNNTIFLAIGGLLASFIGTTGAAMLLIRPLLETNKERKHRVHTVLFTIFIVANCGGILTPLGDPPLFLGYLHGVPFLRLHGTINLLFFAIIILSVAFAPSWDGEALAEGHVHSWTGFVPWREIIMFAVAGLSYKLSDKKVRFEENAFTWGPIMEVATLFIGIFSTMAPALRYLEQIAPSLPLTRMTYFVFTGGLSSVLDNAPTYMTFFEMAKASGGEGTLVAGVPEYYLIPISLGAVFCGAITYIGNGPNFMVKSVAESDGVPMPSFGRYIGYAFTLLVPVLAAMAMIFVGESWLVRGLGIALALGLAFLSLVRIRRAGLDEAVADFSGNE
ncbi:MAG: sodium:proton antiporter [Actinomyces sp.]|nr:sodium:proton antiporter [Actinomyces sp.]